MKRVYVVIQKLGLEFNVYQVYENEQHCSEALAALKNRYPTYEWSCSEYEIIQPLVLK